MALGSQDPHVICTGQKVTRPASAPDGGGIPVVQGGLCLGHIAAQREASGTLGPPRPILLWLPGEGACGPMSAALHWVPSEQLPLLPPRHGGHQGPWRLHFLYPTGQSPWPCPLSWWCPWSFHGPTQPWGLLLTPPLQSFALPGGHCPLSLQSLKTPTQEGTVQGSQIWWTRCPVDASSAPEMATCPSPSLTLRCFPLPFAEKKKKCQALSNLAKERWLNSVATTEGRASMSVAPVCGPGLHGVLSVCPHHKRAKTAHAGTQQWTCSSVFSTYICLRHRETS